MTTTRAVTAHDAIRQADQVSRRVIADAFAEASAIYWERRAQQFRDACSRPSDYRGRATDEQIDARDQALLATAEACCARADITDLLWPHERAIVDQALAGAA